MKDAVGNTLTVGDSVVYFITGYVNKSFQGTVSKICKKTLKIKPDNHTDPEYIEYDVVRHPEGVVKVLDPCKYFLITFDIRKRRTFFHEQVIAYFYKQGTTWPNWLKKQDEMWYPRSRTHGYFDTFNEAEDLMINHSAHWSEGETNEYGLIERVPFGPSPCANKSRGFKEMQWYQLNFDTEAYEKCERPNHLHDDMKQFAQYCF